MLTNTQTQPTTCIYNLAGDITNMDECIKVADDNQAFNEVSAHYSEIERRLQTSETSSTQNEVKDESSCPDANPLVNTTDALAVLLLNIFIPGVGTMLAAYRGKDGFNCKACGFGVAQMITAVVLAGTIWSIIQGVQIYSKSNNYYGSGTVVTVNTDNSSGRRLNSKKLD